MMPRLTPTLIAAAVLACLPACGGDDVEGGRAELGFEGGALDGSEDSQIEADDARPENLRSATPYEVDYVTPIEELVEQMGLSYDEANSMIQLPEDTIRQLAAARKAQIDRDLTDTTPPQPMKGGRLAIRFRHLALDALDDEEYEALLDELVGRVAEGSVEQSAEESAEVGAGEASEAASSPGFPTEIRALDGKDVALGGYMIPVEWDDAEVLEFMLVRDLLACCFGGAPQPDEWVQVRMEKGKGAHYYPFVPVVVHGRLKISGMADAAGYAIGCYSMAGTKVEREE
jgi:hypothetical protein